MGRGMLDLGGWEERFPAKNRAAGARFWLATCRGLFEHRGPVLGGLMRG